MKKTIAWILLLAMMMSLCACGATKEKETATKDGQAQTPAEETEDLTVPVELYMAVMDFSGDGAEAYVESLQEEDSDIQVKYYNEEYYIQTVTEGERRETLAKYMDVDTVAEELFAEYPGVFVDAELSEDLKQITFIVNKDAYMNGDGMVGFAALLGGAVMISQIQSYSMMPLEEREANSIVIMDENNEVIYDSASEA